MLGSLPVLSPHPVLNFLFYVIFYLGVGSYFTSTLLIQPSLPHSLPERSLVFLCILFWPVMLFSLLIAAIFTFFGWIWRGVAKLFS